MRNSLELVSEVNELAAQAFDAALDVHRALGPGLLESIYSACLAEELRSRRIRFAREVGVDISYKGCQIESGLRLDFLVEDILVLELKAVELVQAVHHAQLASYLKLSNRPLGLLLNFNVPLLRDGVQRVINPLYEGAPKAQSSRTCVMNTYPLRLRVFASLREITREVKHTGA